MSIDAENIEQDVNVKEYLSMIAKQLILLNARVEEAFETGIEIEDIEDGDY